MSKLKIVISALVYPFTMMHFFWRAFESREDVELFVLGPYTDNHIPWNNGMKLPRKYVKVPDLALPPSLYMPPYSIVKSAIPWKPDLWIQIDAGFHFSTKPDAGIVAHIQTDPHVLKDFYKVPMEYSDYNFCMQDFYRDGNEILLPYAYDPEIHFHEDREKIYDACLIGLHYEHRNALVKRLKDRGLNVYYSIGEVYSEYRQKYNESKIALSWSSLQDLPSRVFEAWGMELPLLTNRVPDLKLFANEGEHYLGFDDIDEAEQKVITLLSDDKLRNNLARRGHDNAKSETWDNRITQILKVCKLL
jgi:hypothetical protein